MKIGRAATAMFLIVLTLPHSTAAQVLLEYRHTEGDQWHLTSRIDEEVLYDGDLFHGAEILNKISVEVLAGEGGDGHLYNRYQIAERPVDGDVYLWNAEYEAGYARDRRGHLSELPKTPPIPSVRNVPVYPQYPVNPGDQWEEPGRELFNLEPTYGIDEIITIDFSARYDYVGPERFEDRAVEKIRIVYGYRWSPDSDTLQRIRNYPIYPVGITGEFLQNVYWDPETGRNFAEEGRFSYTYQMNDGHSYTFRGSSEGRAVYARPLDRGALVDEIRGLDDVNAVATEEGVSVTLEDIHFIPDSPVMLEGEENTLRSIAGILRRYPDRDILIVGHTAEVYSYSDGLALSESRAETVARYFIENGVRSPAQIVTRGMGHSQPLADNDTEEGRRKNRRVEIIILEN